MIDTYLLTCPLTNKIFLNPVIANDGKTYELEAIIDNSFEETDIKPNIFAKNIIKYCLEKGLINENDIFKPSSKPKEPFDFPKYIIYSENDYVCKYLIDNYDLSYYCQDYRSYPLHGICCYSSPQIIMYALNLGLDLNVCDQEDWRPIHYICKFSTSEVIKYAIDLGVNINVKTKIGLTPLHLICKYQEFEVLEYLLDRNIDIKVTTNTITSIAHYAAGNKTSSWKKTLDYLFEQGFDFDAENILGWKPMHYACECSNIPVIKYLIDKGLELNVLTNNMDSSLDWLKPYERKELIEYEYNKKLLC